VREWLWQAREDYAQACLQYDMLSNTEWEGSAWHRRQEAWYRLREAIVEAKRTGAA
jgi:hypothetical protein